MVVKAAAVALGLLLVVAACSSSDDGEEAGATTDTTATATDEGPSTTEREPSEPETAPELVSPTETDAPFDLSGGAVSSDEGVTVVADEPRAGLNNDVLQATEPWPTDWTRQATDLNGFLLGIPASDPRDFIPPIDTPKFEPIEAATWLADREPGALVQFEGETRFYPLSILTRHEIVNDRYGDVPVAVTFCPLCNTALSFDARVDGQAIRFGVSGLLRNSDLVMWDDATVTLWQQLTGEALVGELAGTQLDLVPTSIVSYAEVRDSFPEALSLSRDTGRSIDYGANPYTGYSSSTTPFLFDGDPDPRFPALSRVVGVSIDGTEKAYPFESISEALAVNDDVGETPVAVLWGGDTADALDGQIIADSTGIGTAIAYDRRLDDQLLTFTAVGDDTFTDDETGTTWSLLGVGLDGPLVGQRLTPVVHRNEFWFAWAAFFPDAPVYGE